MPLGTSIQVTHKFVSGKADGADGTLVQPSKWNQPENFGAGSDGQVPIRDSSATEGASWVDAGAAYGVRGLFGQNNVTTPNTKYDLQAQLAVLRHPTLGYGVTFKNTGAITNDLGLAGPAANGRDQAGVFSASTFIHLYFIWGNGQPLATLSSAVAPPTGPTLPTNYTHWAYATTVLFDAASHLFRMPTFGNTVFYDIGSGGAGAAATILNSGTATVSTSVGYTAAVPSIALRVLLNSYMQNAANTGANAIDTFFWNGLNQTVATTNYTGRCDISSQVGAILAPQAIQSDVLPNFGALTYFLSRVSTGGSSPNLTLWVKGFVIPNGGE